ncbi:MAG: aldolase/citrate lyase family protein [Desulfobacterales bacterium]|jgi:2-dehydro-3-deoxyglucarate aldolase/4-hydroxy-2-oxoheptanedioate aldolase
MQYLFRQRLKNKRPCIGTIIGIPSPETAEVLSFVFFDWLFIDMEHGAFDIVAVQRMLQAVAGKTPCLIRVPALEEAWIKKCLDAGADGIIVPKVGSAAEAAQVVRFSKYPPMGSRSVGLARAHGYGTQFSAYLNQANDAVAVVLQIEHIDAVNHIDEILSVDNIDALFIGPYDLLASMGSTGRVDDPAVVAAMATVHSRAAEAGMPVGVFVAAAADARPYIASVAGLKYSPNFALYSATKFAVRAFSEGLRNEVQAHNIRVATVNPVWPIPIFSIRFLMGVLSCRQIRAIC